MNERLHNAIIEYNAIFDENGSADAMNAADAIAEKYELTNREYWQMLFNIEE